MKRIFSGFLIAAACSSSFADDWTRTAGNNYWEYATKKGSFLISKNKGGIDIAVVTAKLLEKKTDQITLQKWYVTLADCQAQQGTLVSLSIKGEYLYENDFIFDSGSIASTNAKFICGVLNYKINQDQSKGL